MKPHSLIKNGSEVGLRDVERRPKRHQSRYDRVGPGHIPGVRVVMDLDATTEYFALFISRDVQELVPVLRDCPASSRSLKAQLDPETGDRVAVDAPSTNIDLPGDLWPVLMVLKILLMEEVWDGDQLFLDPNDRSALAQTLEMAAFLGCDAVRTDIEDYLRERWVELHKAQHSCAPTGDSGAEQRFSEDVLAYISLSKALEALPDSFVTTHARPGATGPLLSLPQILQLPAQLQVKWLRTDCTTLLDLSQPGNAWLVRHWQSLVGCLSAIPSLVGLKVCLPGKTELGEYNGVHDRTRFAHRDAIAALQQAALHLPHLKFLHLMETPAQAADTHRLAAAIVAFSSSLSHLQLDVFDTLAKVKQFDNLLSARGCSMGYGYGGPESRVDQQTHGSRCTLFGALAQMHKLRVLILPSWHTVEGRECADAIGRALRSMPKLSCVCIENWPSGTCQANGAGNGCDRHPYGVPFRKNDVSVSVSLTAAGVGSAILSQNQATAAR